MEEDELSDLKTMQAYATVIMNFINICNEHNVTEPPVSACAILNQTLVALVIELTALTKSSFTLKYEELFEYIKFTKSKKNKQKVV